MTSATLIVALRVDGTGVVRVPHLLVLAALGSTFARSMSRVACSLVPQADRPRAAPNAIALGSIPWQTGRMIGPSDHRDPDRGVRGTTGVRPRRRGLVRGAGALQPHPGQGRHQAERWTRHAFRS